MSEPETRYPTFEDAIYAAIGCTSIDHRSLRSINAAASQMAVFVRDSKEYQDMIEPLRRLAALPVGDELLIEPDGLDTVLYKNGGQSITARDVMDARAASRNAHRGGMNASSSDN